MVKLLKNKTYQIVYGHDVPEVFRTKEQNPEIFFHDFQIDPKPLDVWRVESIVVRNLEDVRVQSVVATNSGEDFETVGRNCGVSNLLNLDEGLVAVCHVVEVSAACNLDDKTEAFKQRASKILKFEKMDAIEFDAYWRPVNERSKT